MKKSLLSIFLCAGIACAALTSVLATAHGNVTPQGVDTTGLAPLGEKWRDENPFKTNKLALKIGTSAYAQNCARCHGIDAISGGVAPDLRQLDRDCVGLKAEAKRQACYKEMDGYFLATVRAGKVRNGAVYMPPFEGTFNQEAMWAIKTYLETRRETK
ncbi:MAG: cytochrome c-550 PedF [Telluria sp.]